jgi:SAM-dependent methyltransferase
MRLSQKIGKLFHPDGYLSAWAGMRRFAYPLRTGEFVAKLDREGLERIRAKYDVPGEKVMAPKYLDLAEWMPTNVKRVRDIRLFRAPPAQRVLDIGSGAGWFLFIVKCLGHEPLGLDIDVEPIYRETFALLGLPRVVHRIEPYQPLPNLGAPFDLIAAHMTCFNIRPDGTHWGPEEWGFFLSDLGKRLTPTGRVHLDLNPAPDGSHMAPELRRFFLQCGAIVDRRRVFWQNRPR